MIDHMLLTESKSVTKRRRKMQKQKEIVISIPNKLVTIDVDACFVCEPFVSALGDGKTIKHWFLDSVNYDPPKYDDDGKLLSMNEQKLVILALSEIIPKTDFGVEDA